MAEFDETDLRPFTSAGSRRASFAAPATNGGENPPQRGQVAMPPPPSRPSTTMSGARPDSSNRGFIPASADDVQNRPVTSYTSRPTTAAIPQWMFDEGNGGSEQAGLVSNRPKTGYRPGTSRTSVSAERPFSRQGSAVVRDRPVTSFQGRPMTSRTGSAMGRPGSSLTNRLVPGTASRLTETAMRNRPASRSGVGLQTAVSVADRPITQQGLAGLKTGGGRGPQRQFQDKSYFLGLLRTKMSELTTEIGKLEREVESQKEEQSTYLAYDNRVKQLAQELTESQGVLADYNMLVDKLNTDTDRVEVQAECAELKLQNEQTSQEVEQLWAEKREREAQIHQLELELDQEANQRYSEAAEHINQEIDQLNSRRAALEDELSVSAMKREAVRIYEQLAEATAKRDELQAEERQRGTPQQEREHLLQQVKHDNTEISMMERQIVEVEEQLRSLQDERDQLEQDMEDNQSEKNQKYRELKKREEQMDQFLAAFQETRDLEISRLQELENNIANSLESMSRNLQHSGNLPSTNAYASLKEDLAFKEGEIEKSKNTLEGLQREHQQLNLNLEKIEALEEKIKTEMVTLKEKMGKMNEDMKIFSDIDRLREEAEQKRRNLEAEREELLGRKSGVIDLLQDMQAKHDTIKKALKDNETYIQLTNLERKIQVQEQNNFAVNEFIQNKKAESNYEGIKTRVMKLQWEYNKMLQENLKKQ